MTFLRRNLGPILDSPCLNLTCNPKKSSYLKGSWVNHTLNTLIMMERSKHLMYITQQVGPELCSLKLYLFVFGHFVLFPNSSNQKLIISTPSPSLICHLVLQSLCTGKRQLGHSIISANQKLVINSLYHVISHLFSITSRASNLIYSKSHRTRD